MRVYHFRFCTFLLCTFWLPNRPPKCGAGACAHCARGLYINVDTCTMKSTCEYLISKGGSGFFLDDVDAWRSFTQSIKTRVFMQCCVQNVIYFFKTSFSKLVVSVTSTYWVSYVSGKIKPIFRWICRRKCFANSFPKFKLNSFVNLCKSQLFDVPLWLS